MEVIGFIMATLIAASYIVHLTPMLHRFGNIYIEIELCLFAQMSNTMKHKEWAKKREKNEKSLIWKIYSNFVSNLLNLEAM